MEPNNQFSGDLFANVDFSKASSNQNGSINDNEENLYDLSRGKKLIGVGNKEQNSKEALIKYGSKAVVGCVAAIIGFFVMFITEHFFIGLVLLGVGAYMMFQFYSKWKDRCPVCGRYGAMELVLADELASEKSSTRTNVYINGRYSHHEMKYQSKVLTDNLHCCKYCGWSKNTLTYGNRSIF